MKRRPNEPLLYGAHEAAEALGVGQTNLRVVAGLPEPYMKIRATTLWRAKEINKLAIARGRTVTTTPPPQEEDVA